MTTLHWVVVIAFLLLFALLATLVLKDSESKTRVSILSATFVVVMIAMVVALLILDQYIKKAEVVNYSTSRNYNSESVTITGSIKNIGKFKIAYCNLQIKIVNKVKYDRNKKRVFYKTSNSFEDIFKAGAYTKNFFDTSFEAVTELYPKRTKNFSKSIKIPSHFQNLKYFLHLKCH
jgi:glutaredoxin-related protein